MEQRTSVWSSSWLARRVRVLTHTGMRALHDSTLVRRLRGLGHRLEHSTETARVTARIRAIGARLRSASEHASLTGLTARLERAVRASWLFRWLTAEPEPEVIVIDLSETLTVGPLIALLDALLRFVLPARTHSALVDGVRSLSEFVRAQPVRALGGLVLVGGFVAAGVAGLLGSLVALAGAFVLMAGGLLGLRDDRPWAEVREGRAVSLFRALLEPPEPPARRDESREQEESESLDDVFGRR